MRVSQPKVRVNGINKEVSNLNVIYITLKKQIRIQIQGWSPMYYDEANITFLKYIYICTVWKYLWVYVP